MTSFYISPKEIKIKDGLDRLRKIHTKDIKKLAESLKTLGQIHPILLTRDNELIVGGRRLAACSLLNIEVLARYSDETDNLRLRELEIEENIQRKDFTPAEYAVAIDELHTLKKQKSPDYWTNADTASLCNLERSTITKQLQIADYVKKFPELKKCKTAVEITQAIKGIQKTVKRHKAVKEYEKRSTTDFTKIIVCSDAVTHMQSIPDASIDILLTDPPYMMDFDKLSPGAGGVIGSEFSIHGFTFDDSPNFELYRKLAKESFRFCKDTSYAMVFCAAEYFTPLQNEFRLNGWIPYIKPLIWAKNCGNTIRYDIWPLPQYEMILLCRRDNSRLVLQGRPDWFEYNISSGEKSHKTEKPIELMQELLKRVALPGSTIYDPFCGSGASLLAAIREKMIPCGCDILEESISIVKEKLILEMKGLSS